MDTFSMNKSLSHQVAPAAVAGGWELGKRPELLGTAVRCHDIGLEF